MLQAPTSQNAGASTGDSQPTTPSRFSARAGATTLRFTLSRGDLDNIVLMAMRKEPSRRYPSVGQFSEDIRRHLEDRPVLAGKDTTGYRAGKFIRRNKIPLAAAALIIVSLVAGAVATLRQARIAHQQSLRAERRFNDVRQLANNVLFDYHDTIKALPGATKVRERLVKDALVYLDSLAADAHGDPALQRELAAAYERVGDVRGGEMSGKPGRPGGSDRELPEGLGHRRGARGAKSLTTRRPATIWPAVIKKSASGWPTRVRTAKAQSTSARRSLFISAWPGNSRPKMISSWSSLSTHNQLAWAIDEGSPEGAEENRAALAICEKLVAGNPRDPRYRSALCAGLTRMAQSLCLRSDVAGAIEANNRALTLQEALLAEAPLNAAYHRRLVVVYQHAGDYLKETDQKTALKFFKKAAAQDEELLATDPGNALTGKDLAYTHKRIADFLVEQADYVQALPHFLKAAEGYEKAISMPLLIWYRNSSS